MITLQELKKRAVRPWANGSFLRCRLQGECLFPMDIKFATPSGKKLSDSFVQVRHWMHTLQANSKASCGNGYTVESKPVNHRQLGLQHLPWRIYFETEADWLKFIGKKAAFADFTRLVQETRQRQPKLIDFLSEKPHTALGNQADWTKLLTICDWFVENPRSDIYLRQLDIPGIDTKFIEARKGILAALLDRVLDRDPSGSTGLVKSGFERRFGLKYDPPLIRLRILDHRLSIAGFTDLSFPVADVDTADFGVDTVFITENKINGLAFPPVAGSLVIFGLGYGIEMLSGVAWMKDVAICYWGDIDTHGYAILSQMRHYFPQTRSLLMDAPTLMQHRNLWGREMASKRFAGQLPNLTAQEAAVFTSLKDNLWGERIRLEQEHIAYSSLLDVLKRRGHCLVS